VTEEVGVSCPCGSQFQVPASFKGGLANCPKCGRAAPVRGGPEPLFWILLSAGVGLVLAVSAIAWLAGGAAAGGIVLGVGAVVLMAIVLAS